MGRSAGLIKLRSLMVLAALAAAAGALGLLVAGPPGETPADPPAPADPVRAEDADEPRPSRPFLAAAAEAHAGQPSNRLLNETSPYLLQHAYNPVSWYAWGPEAFEAARRQDKPIFLSVGYSTCYWGHVMERESFEVESIAALMNEHFISIKVDREERPDVDDIYMAAVNALTGRGGWPMSTFLEPQSLKPFVMTCA